MKFQKTLLLALTSIFVLTFITSCFPEENQLPDITIQKPVALSTFTIGEIVTIEVEALDHDGFITDFWISIDTIEIFRTTEAPFKTTWNTAEYAAGDHNILAGAKDDLDEKMIVSVKVNLHE